MDTPYPNFATDDSFSNPLQSTGVQSIRFPLHLSNNLYRVGRKHKCPQRPQTQYRYLSVQFSERWVSPESTQGGLILLLQVETTSYPLPRERVLSVSKGGWVVKNLLLSSELIQVNIRRCTSTSQNNKIPGFSKK